MKAYVYVLKSDKDGNKYIGSTTNLYRRLNEHNNGQVKSTRHRRPLKLIGLREFNDIYEAILWEKKYKNSHGQLERDIQNNKITIWNLFI